MREGMNRAGLYRVGSGDFAGACVGCARVLQSMEPMVAGMSMKEILHFERSITNPVGIEWGVGSGADVGADLYMVAPVASASVPSPSALGQSYVVEKGVRAAGADNVNGTRGESCIVCEPILWYSYYAKPARGLFACTPMIASVGWTI